MWSGPATALAGGRPLAAVLTGVAQASGPGDRDGSGTASVRVNPSNTDYVRAALGLTNPGSVIVVDNVVRAGAVDDANGDDNVQGVRRLNDPLSPSHGLSATTSHTVGVEGYDGFTLTLVVPACTPDRRR